MTLAEHLVFVPDHTADYHTFFKGGGLYRYARNSHLAGSAGIPGVWNDRIYMFVEFEKTEYNDLFLKFLCGDKIVRHGMYYRIKPELIYERLA